MRVLLLSLMLLVAVASEAQDQQPAGEALLASGESVANAKVTAFVYDAQRPSKSQCDLNGQPATSALVRWGKPLALSTELFVSMRDGSTLAADQSWAASSRVSLDEDSIKLRRGGRWVTIDRSEVAWLRWEANSVDDQNDAKTESDRVWLVSGDHFDGRLESLGKEAAKLAVGEQPIELSYDQINAIQFASSESAVAAVEEDNYCLVGLEDGSLLHARRVRADTNWLIIDAVAGFTLRLAADRLAFLQPLEAKVEYLSEMAPIDYRHTPYFDLAWPYARDSMIGGGPLAGGGRRAAKGIAMHSAARLVYRLDGAERRFQTEIAIADSASKTAPAGSVIFRVYLVREGRFVAAYESPILRGGDAALPIDIDTTGAVGLALVVDFADQGDAGDHALWLDARLVQ